MTRSERSLAIKTNKLLFWVVLVALAIWVFWAPAVQVPDAMRNIPFAWDYISGMFPPDPSVIPTLWEPLAETVQMALGGTVLATLVAVPLAFMGAINTSPNWLVRKVVRNILNILRSMPALIWAMLFVSLCGLGTLAGLFGIACHSTGTLGKMFVECIEVVGPKISEMLEAMRLDGATEKQAARWGIFPEVAPLFASYVLYRIEATIRMSTMMGFVGAGGLGMYLTMAIRLFRRQESMTIILVIFALVAAVDLFSTRMRLYILKEGGYE